ncbi:hypothetical protein [Thioalkalivibrio thiocyanoxidans]|uniref:hypothetical protein n=1 Tax=Thioalkalivibrio thiocyanoxidans TaxID=152475 RepID=UPI000368C3E1|nr:hypothetical protein [Thioalkalivibrio thiocyanoxidans]
MIPLWFKLVYLAFLMVLVPVYLAEYGPLNFLWLSNIALLGGCMAAWLESRRLAGMLLVAVAVLEMGWVADFVLSLVLLGNPPFGTVDYMYDPDTPLHVRLLSLYHLPLPFVLIWMVWRLGYDPRVWRNWVPLGLILLLISYVLSTPEDSVNWALGPAGHPQEWMAPELWIGLVMISCVIVWWLTHRLALWGFGRAGRVVQPGHRDAGSETR